LKRLSTLSSIRSRIISPEMPSVVATQDITSRSQVSGAKAKRTFCPFQQATSKPSDV
jgi:hypothetical protein